MEGIFSRKACFERREGNKMGGNCYVSSNWINWIVRRNFELHCGCIDLGVKISGMLYTELDEGESTKYLPEV